jgi:hypothetical protein
MPGPRRSLQPGSYPQPIAGVYNIRCGPNFGSGLTIDTPAELYTKKHGARRFTEWGRNGFKAGQM